MLSKAACNMIQPHLWRNCSGYTDEKLYLKGKTKQNCVACLFIFSCDCPLETEAWPEADITQDRLLPWTSVGVWIGSCEVAKLKMPLRRTWVQLNSRWKKQNMNTAAPASVSRISLPSKGVLQICVGDGCSQRRACKQDLGFAHQGEQLWVLHYHRIMEWAGFEGTFKEQLVQPLCSE